MTLYPPPPLPFDCAVCGEAQMKGPWDKYPRPNHPIPPLCVSCEKDWGKAIGGWGDLNRDRRMIRQVSALAEVLQVTAYFQMNNHRGPYERA